MTIDEAISRAERAESTYRETAFHFNTKANASTEDGRRCYERAEEHRQLAEWLRELKDRREADKMKGIVISRCSGFPQLCDKCMHGRIEKTIICFAPDIDGEPINYEPR